MAFTPTFQNDYPTIDADADVWGDILNDRLGEVYTDFQALATQFNVTQTQGAGALQRTGGTMTGQILIVDAGTQQPLAAGFKGVPLKNINTNYTFLLADVGKMIRQTVSGNTMTIPPESSVAFPEGAAIMVRGFGAGTHTIAPGVGVSIRLAGSLAASSIAISAGGLAWLYKENNNDWFVWGVGLTAV